MAKQPYKNRLAFGLWNRYFLSNLNTRLALPWTKLFLALKLGPNTVSILSMLVSVVGMAVMAFHLSEQHMLVGASLLMVGIWWDHSDGQVARATGTGSLMGALLDTIIDRWMESGFILAIAIGFMRSGDATLLDQTAWLGVAIVAWALHANFYVRWSNIQKDIYLIQQEIKDAHFPEPGVLHFEPVRKHDGAMNPVRTFFVPLAFNRDATFWMLFAIALLPDPLLGLAIFALLHSLLGLEKNWYTFQGLRKKDSRALAALMNPDYHK